MPSQISWSFGASSDSIAGISVSGKTEVNAITTASVSLEAGMAAVQELDFQVDDTSKVQTLIISSSLNDGTVEVKADGASAIGLRGPIILFGSSVALFAGNLDKLTVQNKSPDTEAELSVIIGSSL